MLLRILLLVLLVGVVLNVSLAFVPSSLNQQLLPPLSSTCASLARRHSTTSTTTTILPPSIAAQNTALHAKKKKDDETATYRNNIYGLGTNEQAVKILDVAVIVFAVAFVLWSRM